MEAAGLHFQITLPVFGQWFQDVGKGEEEYGHSGESRILGGSGLAQAGWGAAGVEGAATPPPTPAPEPRPRQQCPAEQKRSAPSAGSCEEATEPGEANSPLLPAVASVAGRDISLCYSFHSPSAADYCHQHAESTHYNVSLEKSGT
ncbi:unnamed protein product [Rangifer tarandus platyrhynchus]|uniref:Uncharacterized protein n=1 Tax=Rangifer tarandus platyrhynchus TaxID=3082113 RepID=A0ABN9A5G0_RANTA|nr:unnamed protein product [Rangifer tarandus platyrhynchus]